MTVVCPPLRSATNRHSTETAEIRRRYFSLLRNNDVNWKIALRYHPTELKEEGKDIKINKNLNPTISELRNFKKVKKIITETIKAY